MATSTPLLSDTNHPIIAFNGAITTSLIAQPHRAFAFEVTFLLQHQQLIALASQKPPLHFHPYQEEYMEVVEGQLGIEIEGQERVISAEDGEVTVKPWEHHRLYPFFGGGTATRTKFLLSGQEMGEVFLLDTAFFQNWYGYQDEVLIRGAKLDMIQVMCMFDAGASYLSLPWWVPFGRNLSRAVGIVVGRWIGGLLGYQPFYRRWTSDWELACKKMQTSLLQRRFGDRTR